MPQIANNAMWSSPLCRSPIEVLALSSASIDSGGIKGAVQRSRKATPSLESCVRDAKISLRFLPFEIAILANLHGVVNPVAVPSRELGLHDVQGYPCPPLPLLYDVCGRISRSASRMLKFLPRSGKQHPQSNVASILTSTSLP